MWIRLKKHFWHVSDELVECQDCKCIIKRSAASTVIYVDPDSYFSDQKQLYCQRCRPRYDKEASLGWDKVEQEDGTCEYVHRGTEYFQKIYPDPWKRVNSDGTTYQKSKDAENSD